MKPIRKILVASDFSGPSNTAYLYAQEAAKVFTATVDSLHVVPTLKYFQESLKPMVLPLDMEKNLYPQIKNTAKIQLDEELAANIDEKHRGTSFVIIERKIAQSIADFAEKNGYDLVVIGNIGSHGSKTHRGSIAERIVRKSTVPVFAVPNIKEVQRINHILVPLELTPLSMRAIPLAVYLAKTLKADVTFLNIIELYESRATADLVSDEAENTFRNLIQMANDELEKLSDGVSITILQSSVVMEGEIHLHANNETHQIPLHGVVKKGINAYNQIVEYANDEADMLVMTTHGSEGITHFLLGSTTEKVVYNMDMPIITIRPKQKK
jgi:nucleotide-binding universal stress UspA family protein